MTTLEHLAEITFPTPEIDEDLELLPKYIAYVIEQKARIIYYHNIWKYKRVLLVGLMDDTNGKPNDIMSFYHWKVSHKTQEMFANFYWEQKRNEFHINYPSTIEEAFKFENGINEANEKYRDSRDEFGYENYYLEPAWLKPKETYYEFKLPKNRNPKVDNPFPEKPEDGDHDE